MGWVRCGLGTPSSVLSLPTPSEASGAIARFNTDLTENLLSAVAEFSASQASGTPTPSSPIPITPVNSVKVTRAGKNLFDDAIYTEAGWTLQENGYYNGNAQALLKKSRYAYENGGIKTSGVVTISFDLVKTSGNMQIYALMEDNHGVWSNLSGNIATEGHKTFTTPSGRNCIAVGLNTTVGAMSQAFSLKNFQVEISPSETTYEAYNGDTKTLTLGGDYYGGSFDAVTGKITLTHQFYNTLGDNISNVVKDSSSWRVYYSSAVYGTDNQYKEGLCDKLGFKTSYSGVNGNNNSIGFPSSAGTQILIRNDALTSAQEVRDFMPTLNAVYPLATPIVVYASNTAEIPTIVGDNQVFADTGDVAVKFLETVGHKI